LIRVQVKRVIITLGLGAMKAWGIPVVMLPTIGLSKSIWTKVPMVKRRFVVALLSSVLCIGLGLFSSGGSAQGPVGADVIQESDELGFDWVQDNVESELACVVFESCLHIEVFETSRCLENVAVDFRFEDEYRQWLGDGYLVVPSPRFSGGFVIEIGTDNPAAIGHFGIYQVTCTAALPTEIGIA
jgi:hypothetical protein